jgi:four helix bundle protein
MGIRKFEDLNIWNESLKITKDIYNLSAKEGFSRDFCLRDQIRKSMISVSSNIVEAFERNNNNKFIRFLKISKGSAGEARCQLYIALEVEYISQNEFNEINSKLIDLTNQIGGLIAYLIKKRKDNEFTNN